MFIPTYVASMPSPRAQELARQLAEVIRQYRSSHPDLSAIEVQQAFGLATTEAGPAASASRRAVVGIALGAAIFAGALVAVLAGRQGSPPAVVMLSLAILIMLVLAMLAIRRG